MMRMRTLLTLEELLRGERDRSRPDIGTGKGHICGCTKNSHVRFI